MDKSAFEASILEIDTEMETIAQCIAEAKRELADCADRMKVLRKRRTRTIGWGEAQGFVARADLLPTVIQALDGNEMTTRQLADALDADPRAVSGALRRGVGMGQLVVNDGVYAKAPATEVGAEDAGEAGVESSVAA